jgi:hypothetical protein
VAPLSTQVPNGGTYQAWASPSISWTDGGGPHTAAFAFWSVTGADDGSSIVTSQAPTVNVAGTDVAVTAWYIRGGGNGNGGPGVTIDAFDVNQGMFVDDDFVDVTSDPSLTIAANNDGFVPTPAASQDVRAYGSIHAVPFEDWLVVSGEVTVANLDLLAPKDVSAIAFAFYHSPTSPKIKAPGDRALGTWVSWGVMVDGGGPTGRGPVPPWNPFLLELAVGLALAETAQMARPGLQKDILRLAARQIQAAAESILEHMK